MTEEPCEAARFGLEVRVADGLVEEVAPRRGRRFAYGGWTGMSTSSVRGRRWRSIESMSSKWVGGIEFTVGQEAERNAAVYRWEAKGPAEFFLTLLGLDQWKLTGAMQAHGAFCSLGGHTDVGLDPSWPPPLAHVSGGDLAWGGFGADEHAAFDMLTLKVAGEDDVWRVESLALEKGDAVVRAAGEVKRESGAAFSPAMDLSVTARGLTFPMIYPFSKSYGLGGEAEFAGVLLVLLSIRVVGKVDDPLWTVVSCPTRCLGGVAI